MQYVLIGVAVVLLGGLVAMLCYTLPIALRVYRDQLVRTSPDKWGRVCSAPENEEQLAMWNAGGDWARAHRDAMREVSIENEGLKLFGEYYDFGSDRCAIILPGRCESLGYSYYFAEPYEKAGLNVLVIDTRCHGKSDGKYNTIGVAEARDLLKWVEFLQRRFSVREIWLHGICIGTSSCIFAMADKTCPDAVRGLVTEGCYTTFRETFKNHMIADHRPLFPVLDLVMLEIFLHTGTNVLRRSPLRVLPKLRQPVLFLFGEQDIFSVPKQSRRLFGVCGSDKKRLVWFPKGGHSHLRIHDPVRYDHAIAEFVNE